MTNNSYTKEWESAATVEQYAKKWSTAWDRYYKHQRQCNLISKYLRPNFDWLDFPVGSGRLFESIQHPMNRRYAADYSTKFLDYCVDNNIVLERNTRRLDLFNVKLNEKYEMLTCTNTLFAFTDFERALLQVFPLIEEGGIFIFNVRNKEFYQNRADDKKYILGQETLGWTINDAKVFLNANGFDVLNIKHDDVFDWVKGYMRIRPISFLLKTKIIQMLIDFLTCLVPNKLHTQLLIVCKKRKPPVKSR